MIVTWNMGGLNKRERHIEIGAHLRKIKTSCVAMLETRVKENNANKIRRMFEGNWNWIDNYKHHPNGRIWVIWKKYVSEIRVMENSYQLIHCEMLNKTQVRQCWLTVVYAHNHINMNRELWNHIQRLANTINEPWMVIGDYNNILIVEDGMGGYPVQEVEYYDLKEMMKVVGLF